MENLQIGGLIRDDGQEDCALEHHAKKVMTFNDAKERTADDLRKVAGFLSKAADEIAAGNLQLMDGLLSEKLPLWFDMLHLRYSHVQENIGNLKGR